MQFIERLESVIGKKEVRTGGLDVDPLTTDHTVMISGERGFYHHGGSDEDTYTGLNGLRDIYHYRGLGDATLPTGLGEVETLNNYRAKDDLGRDEDMIVFDKKFDIVGIEEKHLTRDDVTNMKFDISGVPQAKLVYDTESYSPHTYIVGDANGDGWADSLISVREHITADDIHFGFFGEVPLL